MKTSWTLLALAFVLVACNAKLQLEPRSYSESSTVNCISTQGCAKIKLDVLVASAKNTVSDSLNKAIFNAVKNSVYAGENPKEVTNYKELSHSFITTYAQVKKELAQNGITETASWEASATATVGFQSKKVLNVVIEYYIFTGGAHGNGAVRSLLLNPKTGKNISAATLFSDPIKVTQLVEQAFRKKFNIAPSNSLNNEGYFFPNSVFVLPKNILFKEQNLVFHYNPYEIASYANGPIDIELPYQAVAEFLLVK
jgi:hypothetical protein